MLTSVLTIFQLVEQTKEEGFRKCLYLHINFSFGKYELHTYTSGNVRQFLISTKRNKSLIFTKCLPSIVC